MMHRLAESGLRVPACASLLSGMETIPSQGVKVLVLAGQDFEGMFLADTQARLGIVTLREHDTTMLPLYHLLSYTKTIQNSHNDSITQLFYIFLLAGSINRSYTFKTFILLFSEHNLKVLSCSSGI